MPFVGGCGRCYKEEMCIHAGAHTQREKMKPLVINLTAFVEIYWLKRFLDLGRSITKDTVLRIALLGRMESERNQKEKNYEI